MTNNNLPQLRFPGFDNEWEQYNMGELYTERKEKGNEQLQMLTVSIHTGVSDGELDEEDLGKAVKRSEDKSVYKRVYSGDLVFNMMRAWQGAIGVVKKEGMVSPAYISAIPNDKIFPLFMDYAIRRKKSISQINDLSYGVTDFRKRLYWDSFVKVTCSIPSVEEQCKIWSFFRTIDDEITLNQRKLDNIKEYKTGMLQKMFPKEGKDVPEVRFPGFTDAWEQCKLGEIAKTTIGEFVIKTKQDDSYPYPVFNGGSSNTGFYNEFNNEGNKILVSARGANAGFVNIIKTRYWAGNSCYSVDLINKTEFDTDFIYQEMKRNQSRFTDNQQAANIPSVSKSDVEKFVIEVPKYAEQVKIANYFNNLDNLITLHQRKLEELKEYKQGLLQQMFV